jgi:hypothetical protein
VKVKPAGPGAQLFREVELLGDLPGTFLLEQSALPIQLRAEREGYEQLSFEVHPDKDREYVLAFEPLAHKAATKGAKPTAPRSSTVPAPPPAPPKPEPASGHGLMDPFLGKK